MFFVIYDPLSGEVQSSGNVQAEVAHLVYLRDGQALLETDAFYPASGCRVELEPAPHVVPLQ